MRLADSNPGPDKRPKTTEVEARAALRQAVWEASQFLDPADVRAYVEAVLSEIKSDEP